MKYHVTIEADYWPQHVPNWEELTPSQRSQAVRDHCDRISIFLNEHVQYSETRLLVTTSHVTIDPLHGDVGIRPIDALERNSHLPEDGE